VAAGLRNAERRQHAALVSGFVRHLYYRKS